MVKDRYQFVKEITQGGQGTISLYQDTVNNRPVIIKTSVDMTETNLKRFLREAETMKSIRHPNLVEYIDFLENPPRIVMEYLTGGNLKEKIKKESKIPWREAIDIILQVSNGLSALHDKGIIHRDIKPANILFANTGKIKLGDFGVVKAESLFMEQLTVAESLVKPGTILYAPPEFFSPDIQCDLRADIYSLGVTFYEMVTGQQPFSQPSDLPVHNVILSAMIAIINGTYPAPQKYLSDLPEEVVAIIKKMMSVQMEDRYESLGTLRKDLEHLLAEEVLSLTTTDPLVLLGKNLGLGEIGWAQEELVQNPSAEQLKYFLEVKTSLNFMPGWRRNVAIPTLLKFALRYGKWKDACELSAIINKTNSPFHEHLLAVAKRIQNGGNIAQDWYFEAKEKVKARVWPEEEFQCKHCQKVFTRKDVNENKVFFLPDIYCQDCLLKTGKDFAGYKLSQIPVSKDTLGTFFLAISQAQSRPYILHRIPWERSKIPTKVAQNIIERYKRGILVASRLRGANWILSINNPYPLEDKYHTYFFLDYRPSRRLVHFTRKQNSNFSTAKAYILLEILRALELLKATGAIHRYIAPHNINIDFDGSIWLGGFNLAKFDEHTDEDWVEVTMDLSGVRIGNPYYMAPEQFKGMKYTDHRSDLWAWAAVGYQLLTGTSLFKETKTDILQMRRTKLNFTPIRQISENTPEKYAAMLEKCLSENPEARYSDAGVLLGDMTKEISDWYHVIKNQKT